MKHARLLLMLSLMLVLAGCMPDRLPPLPREQERPILEAVMSPPMVDVSGLEEEEAQDSIWLSTKGFAVSVDSPIVLQFDDMMDISTFDGNVLVYSPDGDTIREFQVSLRDIQEIIDTTVNADSAETTITVDTTYRYIYELQHEPFTYSREYFMEIHGDIRDTSGNSISIDPDFLLKFEFFTEGIYSLGGIERAYLADLTAHEVLAIDTLHSFVFTADVNRPTGFATDVGNSKLYVSDKSTSNNYIPIFDVQTGVKTDSVDVGRNQVGIAALGNYAVVATRSPRQLSFLYLPDDSVITQIPLSFTPIVVAYNGALAYVGDASGNLYVYDMAAQTCVDTIEGVFTRGSRSRHLVSYGDRLYANDYNGNAVKIIDQSGGVQEIALPENTHPVDVAVGDYIYVAGADGLILKYHLSTGELVDSTNLGTHISSIDVALGSQIPVGKNPPMLEGELLYLVLPDMEVGDYSGFVGILNPFDLRLVRLVPTNNTASEIWIRHR